MVGRRSDFRRAAEDLHVAQPALSRQIQALERQLGVRLLAAAREVAREDPDVLLAGTAGA